MRSYFVDINAPRAGIKQEKPFVTFKRSGNQIVSQEFLDFDCNRIAKGWISAELRGVSAFLNNGVRIPIRWEVKTTQKFS